MLRNILFMTFDLENTLTDTEMTLISTDLGVPIILSHNILYIYSHGLIAADNVKYAFCDH